MNKFRRRIYQIIEVSQSRDAISQAYDMFMMVVIVVSLLPLTTKSNDAWVSWLDCATVTVFIIDYFFRILTADYKFPERGTSAFFTYPITPMAIIDMLCILPSFNILGKGFRVLKVLRLFRTFRVFRVFKLARYSRSTRIIINVLQTQREPLMAVCGLAVAYILISALIVFNVEPETFDNFFEAVYWATVSLTTVGYGDVYPVTTIGRVVTMVSSMFGIAIVALPAGIITAGYMDAIQNNNVA